MKEYIERAALKRELAPYEENDFSQQMDVILAIVDAQPTADVAPIRHAHWFGVGSLSFRCSGCGCKNDRETAYYPTAGQKCNKRTLMQSKTHACNQTRRKHTCTSRNLALSWT